MSYNQIISKIKITISLKVLKALLTRYPHITVSCLLIFFLGLPFAMRFTSTLLEPYPAILLPSKPSKINIKKKQIKYTTLSLYGVSIKTSKWERIDPVIFVNPIRIQYLNGIVKNNFGLEPGPQKSIKKRRFLGQYSMKFFNSRWFKRFINYNSLKSSESDKEETREWLSSRLVSMGFSSNSIKVLRKKITRDKQSGEIVFEQITNEKIYDLD